MLGEFKCEYTYDRSLLAYKGCDGVIDGVIDRVMVFRQK